MKKNYNCVMCGAPIIEKDVIGINRKLLGKQTKDFFCMDCFASYLGTTVEDLIEKIEEFKEEGCTLFK